MMKFRRFFVSLILAFVTVALCGSVALAAPFFQANHVSRVLLNASFKPDYSTADFLVTWLDINNTPTEPELTGELTLNGDQTFELKKFIDGYGGDIFYAPVGENGEELESDLDAELSGMSFSFTLGEEPAVSGTLPVTRSTAEQLNAYVPYVELIVENSRVTGFKWRLVSPDNPEKVLVRDDAAGIDPVWVGGIRVRKHNGEDVYRSSRENGEIVYEEGDELPEVTVTLPPAASVDLRDLQRVRINVRSAASEESRTENADAYYSWSFVPTSDVMVPEQELVNKVASTLGIKKSAPVNPDLLRQYALHEEFRTAVGNIDGLEIDFAVTMAALLVSQDVPEEGGAVMMDEGTALMFNTAGYDGTTELDVPTSLNDLRTHYSILKSFPGGGTVDLLAKYPDLFEFTQAGVDFKAIIAIIDAEAPASAQLAEGSPYGVELKNGILCIYDGKPDKIASDPITLQEKKNSTSDSNSGCDAGFGAFALLFSIVAWAMLKRKHLK